MISKQFATDNQIQKYKKHLSGLLSKTPVKYSEWHGTCTSSLSQSAGIYHFFECNDDNLTSLYVGKAGLGKSKKWSLLKRLNQHFQVSQKNTLIGKIAKVSNEEPEIVKQSLCDKNVFVQWLVLFGFNSENIESELVWSECFCKSILMPKHTNA